MDKWASRYREASMVQENPPNKNVWTHYKGKGYDHNNLEYDISQV